jgi:hypothetical protein
MRAKLHTKVWRLAENEVWLTRQALMHFLTHPCQVITSGNVLHALSLLGQEHSDKKSHFEKLLPRLDLDEDDFTDGNADEDDTDGPAKSTKRKAKGKRKAVRRQMIEPEGDSDGENDDVHPILRSAPMHRIIFPPFVRLPGPFSRLDESQSLQSYIPWTTGLNIDQEDDAAEDDDSEAEREAFFQELDEEVVLDEQDQASEAYHEEKLWEQFGASRLKRAASDERADYADGLRKRRKVVKTAEFVEESEE